MSTAPAQRNDLLRNDLLPIVALLILGSVAFVRLMSLPAFEDEGSQLRWIFRLIQAGEWLQTLGDGTPRAMGHPRARCRAGVACVRRDAGRGIDLSTGPSTGRSLDRLREWRALCHLSVRRGPA